jgi:catechol 2,3-dioxygenase-like lactoylglutathione lyase family enzyme
MDLRWDAVTIDCADPEKLAEFYSALLGVQIRGRWEQYVGMQPSSPGQPRLVFQRTDDPRPEKNTLHLDLHVAGADELVASVDRAESLGARRVERVEEAGETWQTMADPEGNVFCLVAD